MQHDGPACCFVGFQRDTRSYFPGDDIGAAVALHRYGGIDLVEKVGPEFQVNPLSTSMALPPVSIAGDQGNPNIAMDASGRFVVLWESTDASLSGIFAQRFNSDATPLGDPFALNQETALDQVSVDISMNADGQWVAAWVSDHRALIDENDAEKSIFLQTFATFDAAITDSKRWRT